MTPERMAALAERITRLDRQITDADRTAARARAQRRKLRAQLRAEGWSLRDLAVLSAQSPFAVAKDIERAS